MGNNKVVSGEPFLVHGREGYTTVSVTLEITNIGGKGELLEFESEDPIVLSPGCPQRDVYYQSEQAGDDELVFFGVELKDEAIYLTPGNSNIDTLYMNIESTAQGMPVSHKRVAARA